MEKKMNNRKLVSIIAVAVILFGYGVGVANAQSDASVMNARKLIEQGKIPFALQEFNFYAAATFCPVGCDFVVSDPAFPQKIVALQGSTLLPGNQLTPAKLDSVFRPVYFNSYCSSELPKRGISFIVNVKDNAGGYYPWTLDSSVCPAPKPTPKPTPTTSWINTRLITTKGNNLYTIETDGKFFETNLSTGVKTEKGSGFQNARFLYTDGNYIYSITSSGSPMFLEGKSIVGPNNWMNTRLLTQDSTHFYTIETDGGLYRTDFKGLVKNRIGPENWPSVKHILAVDGAIVIIGDDEIYAVNSENGSIVPTKTSMLKGTRAATFVDDGEYILNIESSGLYLISTSGYKKSLVEAGWRDAKFLFSVGTELWLINGDGVLYRIDYLGQGKWSKRFPT